MQCQRGYRQPNGLLMHCQRGTRARWSFQHGAKGERQPIGLSQDSAKRNASPLVFHNTCYHTQINHVSFSSNQYTFKFHEHTFNTQYSHKTQVFQRVISQSQFA